MVSSGDSTELPRFSAVLRRNGGKTTLLVWFFARIAKRRLFSNCVIIVAMVLGGICDSVTIMYTAALVVAKSAIQWQWRSIQWWKKRWLLSLDENEVLPEYVEYWYIWRKITCYYTSIECAIGCNWYQSSNNSILL